MQERNTFGKSCVVERLEQLPAREHTKHRHGRKGPRNERAHGHNMTGTASLLAREHSAAGALTDSPDATPRFTFVVIDIGRIFPDGMSVKAIERRKRKSGWWAAATKRAKKVVRTASAHFAEGTAFVVTSGEAGYQGLLEKITKDGHAAGWIGKPYTASGARKLLRRF